MSQYNDDEQIQAKQILNINPIKNKIELQIKAISNKIRINQNEQQQIPAMLSINQIRNEQETEVSSDRAGIDLLCVIDVSGSMSGTKIDLVKDTLDYMLSLLQPQDRLCLIQFDNEAKRLTALKKVYGDSNIQEFKSVIQKMQADGGTNIAKGMQIAFDQLKGRKYKNAVSSIFLLSDGLDQGADIRVSNQLKGMQDEVFSINCFGFGNDHDEKMMQEISKARDGNFYFVEQLEVVDQCFVDALGGLMSVLAQNITLKIRKSKQEGYPNSFVKISKTYGDFWKAKDNNTEFRIDLTQLIEGVHKDFLFEIELSALPDGIGQREICLVDAEIEFYYVSSDILQSQNKQLKIHLVDFNENDEIIVDDQVQKNQIRVKSAEAIEQAQKLASQNKFEDAQKLINDNIEKLVSLKNLDDPLLKRIRNDLKEATDNLQPQQFQEYGQKRMVQAQGNMMYQKSRVKQASYSKKTAPQQRRMNIQSQQLMQNNSDEEKEEEQEEEQQLNFTKKQAPKMRKMSIQNERKEEDEEEQGLQEEEEDIYSNAIQKQMKAKSSQRMK